MRLRRTFHKLESVTPGIFGVEATHAWNRNVVCNCDAVGEKSLAQFVEVSGGECGVSFFGGAEILFDANVELLAAALIPAAAPSTKRFGLLDFSQAQEIAIKIAGSGFAAFGGGDLEVIEMCDSRAHFLEEY